MKKIFLLLVVILLTSANAFCADYYLLGVDCFNKGDYQNAAKNLESAILVNPQNVNARYYLAQVYLKQKRTDDAKNQYNRIIILAPMSEASNLSMKGLSLIVQANSLNSDGKVASYDDFARYKDNYLEYVLTGKEGTMKWESFPVRVYIEPNAKKQVCKDAFMQWQEKTKKLVSFTFVPTPKEAQISVVFKDRLENSATDEGYIAGTSRPYYQGKNIVGSEIKILSSDPNTRQERTDSQIHSTVLHEIGHSLGMKGHSPSKGDIMYSSSSEAKNTLTQRDLNTVALFYKIDKNTIASKVKGGMDVQLQQAIEYANSMPTKAIGWINLGEKYKEKEMYSEALKSYKKALAIEPQKADLHAMIASTLVAMGDKKSAISSYQKACDLDKSNTIYLYNFANLCLETGQKTIGQVYINRFIQANPQSNSDERIQALKNLYGN